MLAANEEAFRFEGFTLELKRGCLKDEVGEVDLRPKCFELLRHLVENAGRLVSKDELMRAVWPNVIVTDESLARCVSDLRLALRDQEQRIIRTVRARGFLFTPHVRRADLDAEHTSPPVNGAIIKPPPPRGIGPVRPSETQGQQADAGPPAFTDLALPLIDQIVATSALRGAAYEGFYRTTRPYAAQPGAFIHDNLLVRMHPDGVLRFKMATGGVMVDGWVLPVHTQLYVIGTEFGSGGLVFAILHGVSSIKAGVLDGITLSSTFDAGRTPAAAAVVFERIADLTDDAEADDARLIALDSGNPVAAPGAVPEDLRRHLTRDLGAAQSQLDLDGVLRLPLAHSRARSAPFAPQ